MEKELLSGKSCKCSGTKKGVLFRVLQNKKKRTLKSLVYSTTIFWLLVPLAVLTLTTYTPD